MVEYTLQRLIGLVPVLLGVTLVTFAIIQVTPGDPVRLMLGEYATDERVAQMRAQLGLDDPLGVQYGRYVWNAARGDLGRSIRGQKPVLDEILTRFPSTVELMLAAMTIATFLGVPAGIIAATAKSKLVDGGTMVVALLGFSIPSFWLGIVTTLVFGVRLRWVPVIGAQGMSALVLPALCLAVGPMATLARLTRSSVLEVMQEDYVRTARGKGLAEQIVRLRHILPNALIPVVTVMGLQAGYLLAGAVFIEAVFARPGIGRFAVNAIATRDYPQIQGMVLFTATVFVLVNLAVDLAYGFLDPRIGYD